MIETLLLLILPCLISAHGFVQKYEVDGTTYAGCNVILDRWFGQDEVSRIQWNFPEQIYLGTGPVLDVTSPDVACRKVSGGAPKLAAKARAGANITFRWTPYYDGHIGPVLTYMGEFKGNSSSPNEVGFFKIDEGGYNPTTKDWATNTLIKNNNSWTVRIPSDVKPGRYIIRHEIVSLHFANNKPNPNPDAKDPKPPPGAQLYPQCINVDVIGSGTAEPATVKFPGGYDAKESGLSLNRWKTDGTYRTPGPPLYQGGKQSPVGPRPVVKVSETGMMNEFYQDVELVFNAIYKGYVRGINDYNHPDNLEKIKKENLPVQRGFFAEILKRMKEELVKVEAPRR